MADCWPDGAPVTPWADPWHDVAADLRAMNSIVRDEPPPRPYLSEMPVGTLDISHEFMNHVMDHWILNRPPGCRWCPDPPEAPGG